MTLIEEEAEIIGDPVFSGKCENEANAIAGLGVGAVVWRRDSWFGNFGESFLPGNVDSCYYIVQVVDGEGEKIDTTWDNFVGDQAACQSETECPTNSFPSLNDDSGGGGFCQCAYTGDLPFGLDNFEGTFLGEGLDIKRRGRQLADEMPNKNSSKKPVRKGGIADHSRRLTIKCDRYSPAPTPPTPVPSFMPTNKSGKSEKRRRRLEE
jgi:hypothetical protein